MENAAAMMTGLYSQMMSVLNEVNMISILVRILLAMAAGGMLGFERARENYPSGMRTYMLVSLGAAVTMLTGQYIFEHFSVGDPARIGAQVITGVGFLGAGNIIVEGRTKIRGLTTAAGLWASACIGLAIGIGFYSVGIIATLCVYVILTKFKAFSSAAAKAEWFGLYLEFSDVKYVNDFYKAAEHYGLECGSMSMGKMNKDGTYVAVISVRTKTELKTEEMTAFLRRVNGVNDLECIELN